MSVIALLIMLSSTASENVSLQPGCLDAIMNVSGGDMRKAVTYLQTCHQLSAGNAICLEDVVDISGQVSTDESCLPNLLLHP